MQPVAALSVFAFLSQFPLAPDAVATVIRDGIRAVAESVFVWQCRSLGFQNPDQAALSSRP
jgi:hypothetical protein